MINFSSLFNQWRTQNNSGVIDLLSQPGLTIGRLLDEESFQGQYKSGNAKLTQFMKYPRYEELIEFVTVVGPADDKKRSYKYPLSACEILSLDNNTALDFFLPEKPITVDTIVTETVEVETEVEVELIQAESINPTQQNQPSYTSSVTQEKPETAIKEEHKEQVSPSEKEEKSPEVPEEKSCEVFAEGKKQTEQRHQAVQTASKIKTKKVIKKEQKTVEKIQQKEMPPLIFKLLAYFDGEVNYTLAGYVSKILGVLLTKRPLELMRYVLEEKMMHKIINHAESRSVGEIIVKVLTHQSTHFLELRRQFFKELLNRTSTSSEIQIMSNLSSYTCQIIEKIATNLKSDNRNVQLNDVFFSLDIITQVIKNVMSQQQNVAVYNAPILLTYLTNVPFVLPEDENIVAEFMRLGELFIEKSCQKLDVQRIDRPKLGFGRIKIIQILKFVLKENVLNSKEVVAKASQFFPILFKLIREYDMNNVLHNEAMKIVDIALVEPQVSPLNKAILRDNILLTFIVEECEEDKKIKAGVSLYSARKGYIAHVINLCVRLRELSQQNQNIKRLTQNPKFTGIYESFAQKEVFNSKKSLAGLIKKEKKHEVMFQKEDIIAQHLTFLQKCPSPIFEPEPEPEVNIEHPDLVEQLQKQLQENLSVKSSSSEEKSSESSSEPESKKVELQVEGQGRYWATHLEYNIDDLIADL